MKTRKIRLLSALLALAMLLALLPTAAFAADGYEEYKGVTFVFTRGMDASIVGYQNIPEDGVVEIPEKLGGRVVTRIQAIAFTGCTSLKTVIIPASVQSISMNNGQGAFANCTNLETVIFAPGSQLSEIGENAFNGCTALKEIICDEAVKTRITGSVTGLNVKVEVYKTVVFNTNGGTAVEEQKVANGKTATEPTAPTKDGHIFEGWYTDAALNQKYDFSKAVTDDITLYAKWTVGGDCGDNLTWTLDDSGTLTISGTGAMKAYARVSDRPWRDRSADIITVVIGSEVTKIGRYAFAGCKNLKTVNLPENGKLEEIGYCAFGDRTVSDIGAPIITEITIPASVKVIDAYAFVGCKELGTVTFAPNSQSQLELINGWAFQGTALTKITIPASITFFDGEAFKDCEKLEEVTFEAPSGLCEDKYNMSNTAFTGCTKLSRINCEAALQEKLASRLPADVKAKVEFNITDKTDSDSGADSDTDPETYPITIDYGTAYDAEHNVITKAAAGDVVTIEASETALDGMVFERWEVRKGEVKLENDRAAETSFTMPEGEVQLEAMYQAADVEDSGWDAATVVTGVAVGTGTAILAYHIGLEVYAEQVLGKDVAVPRTRAEVALLAWQLAGSPAVNVEGEPLSEAAQAQRWAVESGLMQKDAEGNFNGTKKMSKWNALRTLDAAKK